MFSYWEKNSWLENIDVAIIGSGITGLSTAIHLKKKNKKLKVVVLERGMLPSGASTKNAGFACFGSIGEILDDLTSSSESEIQQLVLKRKNGLDSLVDLIGEKNLDLNNWGGYELFDQRENFSEACDKIEYINQLLYDIFKGNVFEIAKNEFGFNTKGLIKNHFESQIDTGKMMQSYIDLAKSLGVQIFNGCQVNALEQLNNRVQIDLEENKIIQAKNVIICSNGFAQSLLQNEDVLPARAQVLITKPIPNLHIKGTFHIEKGYYYFRNIHDRILFGGGRNLAVEEETTTKMVNSDLIIDDLKKKLSEIILPKTDFEIDHTWAGIMGVGKQKRPIVKEISNNVFCGVRLGGMGVALGTQVGKECSQFI